MGDYLQLEQRFAAWTRTQAAIHAVIVVGSRARSDHPADEWADLDLIVFTSNAAAYLAGAEWLNTFGPMWVSVLNSFGARDAEWLAVYEGGLKIDAAFLTVDLAVTPTLPDMLEAFPYPVVLQRGARVLVDKTAADSSRPVHFPVPSASAPPAADEFIAAINRLLLDSIKTAKFIRRREVWRAKQMCDCELKRQLLVLLEWQAAERGRDSWYDGRYSGEWADEQALAALPFTFAAFDTADLQRALFATLTLAQRLGEDIAQQLNYPFPGSVVRNVVTYLQVLLPEGS